MQEAVDKHRSGSLVELVFDRRSADRNFNKGV
jgi:hypothetical protein